MPRAIPSSDLKPDASAITVPKTRVARAAVPKVAAARTRAAKGAVPKVAAGDAGLRTAAQPAEPRRVFEQLTNDIRRRVADGQLKAGDRLPSERELAEQFKVSRNTVREALRSLENAGMLVLRPGSGGRAFIASGYGGVMRTGMADLVSLGLVKSEHLSEARVILGVATVRLAAERRTYGDLEALHNNIEAAEAAIRANDVECWVRLSFEFHRLLAKAAQNPALVVLTDAVIALNDQIIKAAGLRDPRRSAQFRKKVFKHIEMRDADAAATEIAQHLEALGRYYKSKIGS